MKPRLLILTILLICVGIFWWWRQQSTQKSSKSVTSLVKPTTSSKLAVSNQIKANQLNSARTVVAPPPAAVLKTDPNLAIIPTGLRIAVEPDKAAEAMRHAPLHPAKSANVKPLGDIYFIPPNGSGLKDAINIGFAYSFERDDKTTGLYQLGTDKNNTMRFSGTGADMDGVSQALAQLAELAQVRNGSYEARLLGDGLRFQAIWLKADIGGTDLIWPLDAGSSHIQNGRLYTANEYLDDLQQSNSQ